MSQTPEAETAALPLEARNSIVHPLESKRSLRTKARSTFQTIRKKIDALLEHYIFIIFMTCITIYALFADDVRSLIDDQSVDTGFYTFASICLGLFTLEIILSSIAKPGYFLGFFFWLDIISTASLIFDIGWISNEIFGTGGSGSGAAGAAQLARAGRASRVGTRAGRIVRVVRLIRLIRIVKLYKAAQTTLAQKPIADIEEEEEESVKAETFDKTTLPIQKVGTLGVEEPGNPSKTNIGVRDSLSKMPRKESMGDVPHPRKESAAEIARKESEAEVTRKDSGVNPPGGLSRKISGNYDQPQQPQRQSSIEMKKDVADSQTKDGVVQPKQASLQKMGTKLSEQKKGQQEKEKKFELPQETNVGKKLSDLTTKRVITLVMSVMLSIPIFDVNTYTSDFTSGQSGLNSVYVMSQTDAIAYDIALNQYINNLKDIRDPLVVLNINGTYIIEYVNENSLRDEEKQYYNINGDTADTENSVVAYSVFDLRDDTHLNAILSITRTLFVTAVLTAAAMLFSRDANDLVLSPIESMLVKVKRIAENPLAAAQIEEEDALMMEKLSKEGKMKEFLQKKEGNYETSILEKTILKLGALLALGFGEAGSGIIAQNMSKSGDVDPMIPGKKVMAIFGFCDIRQFTDATEVLQEGVMVFVNEIAEIVHGTINSFSGAANKNIGDAFLLVWKFPEDEVEHDADDPSILKLKQSVVVNQLADMSVVSFLKIWSSINRSKKLEKYRYNKSLNERIKNYSVKMGYGLHVGWAIEGAIGSEYKIDASYLSPNVNMAARLEAATKQFGVPFLISGALHDICSPETQKHLRHIDRVTVKGSIQPIDLYTCDVDISKLSINQNEKDYSNLTAIEKKQMRVETRMKRDDLKTKAFEGKTKVGKKFTTDKDLITMRKPFSKEFEEKFKEGMDNYISGNWSRARDLFEATLKMIPHREKDGPSNTLLNYMGEFGYRAPHDWKGFRELTEK